MKCELKYVVHDQIKAFTKHTLKEILIMMPFCIAWVLFLNWCDLENNISWTMLLIAIVLSLGMSSVSAIRHCKNKKD